MKIFFSVILCIFFALAGVNGQSTANKKDQPITIEAIVPPTTQTVGANYFLSVSEPDYKNKNYVFCTDSNATVAYMMINGFTYRLTGGTNAEHILTYSCKNYSVTVSFNKTNKIAGNSDAQTTVKIEATLAIYNSAGKVIGQKVTGEKITAVKN